MSCILITPTAGERKTTKEYEVSIKTQYRPAESVWIKAGTAAMEKHLAAVKAQGGEAAVSKLTAAEYRAAALAKLAGL